MSPAESAATDLFNTGKRPYFRLSELAGCDLRTAHNIIGTPTKKGGSFFPEHKRNISMWMGEALEPVINRFLIEQVGLSLAFHNDRQLEPTGFGPRRIGHPDGLVYLNRPGDLTRWGQYNLPRKTIEQLKDGAVLLLEDKTMRDEDFVPFVRAGGDFSAAYFIAKYPMQISSYIEILSRSEYDDLWPETRIADRDDRKNQTLVGSRDYNAFLEDIGRDRTISASLAAVLNTRTKEIAFSHIEYTDHEDALHTRLGELESIQHIMRSGMLPAPTFDGRAPDCFTCPFTHLCPAIQSVTAELNELQIFPELEVIDRVDLEEWDQLASEYAELKSQENSIAAQLADQRTKMKGKLSIGSNFMTDRFQIIYSSVSGRQSADIKTLAVDLKEAQEAVSSILAVNPLDLAWDPARCYYCATEQAGLDADALPDDTFVIWYPDPEDADNDVATFHAMDCPLVRLSNTRRHLTIPMKRGAGHERMWVRSLYGPTAGQDID